MNRAIAGVAVVGVVCLALGCDEDKKTTEPASSAAAALPTESAPPAPVEPKATPAEAIAKTMKADVAAWNAHDAAAVAACYEPQGKLVISGMPEFRDRQAVMAEAKANFTAFPDFKVAVTHSYVHGNTVAIEWVVTGKNDGPDMGQPATGRTMGILGASVSTFDDDGLIKEEHRYFDLPTLRSQLDAKAKAGTFRPPVALPTAATEEHVSKGTPDEAKTLDVAKAFYAAWGANKPADFAAFLTDATLMEDAGDPKAKNGVKPAVDTLGSMFKAFPDTTMSEPVLFATGDVVVAVVDVAGTNKGPLMGMKPTNKHVESRFLDVTVWKDGKLAHEMSYANSADMLVQLGVMPPIGAAPAASASAAPPAPSAKAK
ncbi:MAG TPA: ester cyclase [Polyangiaceae bacterium]|jgi:steroid delta-isomerase-like uncharacterized protein